MTTTFAAPLSERPDVSALPFRPAIADTLDEVDALENAWRELASRVDYPLSQFHWSRAAISAFADDSTPHVVTLSRGEQLEAVAPLVRRRSNGVARLYLAGVRQLYEPMDLIYTDPQALRKLTSALVRGGTPICLERIGAESPTLAAIKRAFRGRAIVVARPQARCPFITLDESWLEPFSHLNSGRRSDLRRARRKAEQLGQVTTEIRTPDLHELPALLDTAFEVEARSWKGETGTALSHDAQRAVFYRQYLESACVDGILRVCFLRIGDRVSAMQLAIEYGNAFWLLKVGYDAQYSQCSPGLLLMRDTIRYAVEAGLQSYEFLGRAESWTEVWTKTEHPYVSLSVYPLSLRGVSALAVDAAAAAYRRWRKK